MGKVKAQSGNDSAPKAKSFRKKNKFSKSTDKKKSGDRYFNSPLNSNVSDKLKVKKKKGDKFKKNASSTLGGTIAPPKPKRLKKGPFKVSVKPDSPSTKPVKEGESVGKQRKSQGTARRNGKNSGRKPKPDRRNGESSNVGNNDVEQSAETKERIKKIKNSARQKNSTKMEIKKVIIKPGGGKWFEAETVESDPSTMSAEKIQQAKVNIPKENLKQIYNAASALYEKDIVAYRQACYQGNQKSDFQWMDKMMKVGTLPDKMAAFVVKIQDSPIHNLQHLQNLISMVKVQSKQQCLMAADTLKDLFLEDLLPPDRKLLQFEKRGGVLKEAKESQLITWFYEDRLKVCYGSFINSLKQMSLDNVEKIRAKAVTLIYTLLASHPEQEAVLLQILVNKLGDTLKKVASRALFYLNSLLELHPRMKLVVIDEVERLLFRNNIAKRAQYYGICFLNSINLNNEHPEVACKLIGVYVAFFKGCVKTGDIDSKMMSALLTGVNKSYPLAKEYGYKFTENTDTLYKIAHLSNFNICIQSLSILFQLTDVDTRPTDADRYYRVLYKELLRPELATTSHSIQFLNLIYKSMKCDNKLNRVMGFSKRLLMICQSVQPNLACAILFLLSEVAKVHTGIIRCGSSTSCEANNQDISLSDAEDESEGAQANENILNLMKISNVKVSNDEATETVGIKKKLKKLLPEDISVPTARQPEDILDSSKTENNNDDSVVVIENVKVEYKQEINAYDPYARNPCYCGAEFSLSHEVATLASHFHPSVALFAEHLLRNEAIVYEGNPLKDFTITRFLERFVYRNSKKPKSTPGGRTTYQPKGLRNLAVNSVDYLKNEEDAIPVEEKFFYRYFKEKKKTTDDNVDEESETESVGDEEFDDLMANYFKSRKGKGTEEDDDMSEDLDFAANINADKAKKTKRNHEESESDDGEDMEGDISDEDMVGDADEMIDMDADEMIDMDEDDEFDFQDEDDELDFQDEDGLEVFEEDAPINKKKMRKLSKDLDMFAPAEQFAEMLEANADENISGPSQLISRDHADPKQLQWEMERDRWAKGYKRNMKSTFKGKNKGRPVKQKRRK